MKTRHARGAIALLLCSLGAQGCGWWFDDGDSDSDIDENPQPPPPDGPAPLLEEPFEGECVPATWIPEAPAPWGTPAAIDLRGTQVRIDTTTAPHIHSIAGSMRIEPADPELPVIAFGDATIDATGTTHEGTLVVVGAGIVVTSGTIGIAAPGDLVIADDHAWLRPWPVENDDGTRPALGMEAAPEHQASIDGSARYDLDVQAVELGAFDRAYVVTDTATIQLVAPISVTAPVAYWTVGSMVGARQVDVQYSGEIFVGIAAIDGTLSTEDGEVPEPPMAIFTRDARLDVGPDHVRTIEDAPVRQALGLDEALVGSEVEIRSCQADTLVFGVGQTRNLRMAYRQVDGLTDAVISEVLVELADGSQMLTARVQLDGTLPAALTTAAEAHPDAAWGQGIIDFVERWVEVTQAITEGLTCVFTFGLVCPDSGSSSSPPQLVPYPAWMEPARYGEFELELTAPYEVGEYDLVVHMIGQNYEATLPLHMIVQ